CWMRIRFDLPLQSRSTSPAWSRPPEHRLHSTCRAPARRLLPHKWHLHVSCCLPFNPIVFEAAKTNARLSERPTSSSFHVMNPFIGRCAGNLRESHRSRDPLSGLYATASATLSFP